jgi:putative nucleotidyltransferase with HDIG domain
MDALAPPAARAPFDAWLDAALRRLAPISPWAMTLLTMRPDAEGTDRALARLIASDPALLARVLGAANARPFNPQAHEVIDVAHAIRRLGTREVWRIATVLALGASARIRPELRPAKRALWAHSFTVAHAARGVAAAAREGLDADRVFVAGLLHDIGLMVLLSVEPQRCVAMLGQVADPAVGFSAQLERDASLPPHARVGGEVCRRWGLPAEIAALVGAHGLVHPLDLPAPLRSSAAALELGHQIAERTAPPQGLHRAPERDDAPLLRTVLRLSQGRLAAIRASVEAAGPKIAEIAATA